MTAFDGTWGQPAVFPGPMPNYTGEPTAEDLSNINLMPQWQGFGLEVGEDPWDGNNPYWKNSSQLPRTQVIGNSRLVTNTDDNSACGNCISLDGAFAGPNFNVAGPYQQVPDINSPTTYPTLFFDGDFLCGEGSAYVIDCETGDETLGREAYELGACVIDGETTTTSLETCDDYAQSLNPPLRTGRRNPLWLKNMIDPALLTEQDPQTGAEFHAIHKNQFRPTWSMWFTPPANSMPDPTRDPTLPSLGYYSWCPPINPGRPDAVDPLCTGDQPEFIVPPWEYIGTYVEWTGWDPARWWDELTTFNRAQTGDPNWNFLNSTKAEFLEWFPPLNGLGTPEGTGTGLYPAPLSADFSGIRNPTHYGHVASLAIPPTCLEFSSSLGLATQRGVALPWDDPDTGESLWPTYPEWDRWVYHWQMQNSDPDSIEPMLSEEMYPWDDGWNRWQTTIYLFDIGDPTPYPVFHGRGRYLNRVQNGTTEWLYQGDQVAPPEQSRIL